MTKEGEPKKLRLEAAEALVRGDLPAALSLYSAVCEQEPNDPTAPHRAGGILNRLGRRAEAVRYLHLAADLYSKQGFVLKAMALCKLILKLDPGHRETQYLLWILEAAPRDATAKTKPVENKAPHRPSPTPRQPENSPRPDAGREPPGTPASKAIEDEERGFSEEPLDDFQEDAEGDSHDHPLVGSLQAAPVLRAPLRKVEELHLTKREAFILSQVDGRMRFEDILEVSGLPRQEALNILVRLLTEGIIGLP
jgi:tetratricopeptide (TPR) repeat protein